MRTVLRRRQPTLYDRAETLRALAALLKAGYTFSSALEEWPRAAPGLPSLDKVSRRVVLGFDPETALSAASDLLGEDAWAIRAAAALHRRAGADPVPILERAAAMVEGRADARAAGRASVAGAKLSGWMVGGLPLVSLPLLPMAKAPLFDGAGLAFLFFGLVLTAVGMVWMASLVPDAALCDDPFALFADHVAAGLEAGASVPAALEISCDGVPASEAERLLRARRRVRLGETWPDSLAASVPELIRVADAIRRANRLGSPLTRELTAYAAARRAVAERTFDRAVRRAPVLMVLPLVLCVLPAFGLLAIVPFLRSIAFA